MAFEKRIWVDVEDPDNLPELPQEAIEAGQNYIPALDATELNRIEGGIEENDKEIAKRLPTGTFEQRMEDHINIGHISSPLFLRDVVFTHSPPPGYTINTFLTRNKEKAYWVLSHLNEKNATVYNVFERNFYTGEWEKFNGHEFLYATPQVGAGNNIEDGTLLSTDTVSAIDDDTLLFATVLRAANSNYDYVYNMGFYLLERGKDAASYLGRIKITQEYQGENEYPISLVYKDNYFYFLTYASRRVFKISYEDVLNKKELKSPSDALTPPIGTTSNSHDYSGVIREDIIIAGVKIIENGTGEVVLEVLPQGGLYAYDESTGLCIGKGVLDDFVMVYDWETKSIVSAFKNPNNLAIDKTFIIDGYLYILLSNMWFRTRIT